MSVVFGFYGPHEFLCWNNISWDACSCKVPPAVASGISLGLVPRHPLAPGAVYSAAKFFGCSDQEAEWCALLSIYGKTPP